MNKQFFKILLLTFSLLALTSCRGQKNIDKDSPDKNWKYIAMADTQTVKVVEYFGTHIRCGTLFVTSMAICVDKNNDSLRIIEHCPDTESNFQPGQVLKFYPYKHITDKNIGKYKATDEFVNHKYNSVVRTAFGDLKSK
jgi:hypothetical protein